MLCDLHIVVVQLLLGSQCKAGGDDGQRICAQLLSTLAHADGLCGGDAAGTGIHGHAALDLIDDGLQHLFLLMEGQGIGLAVGAHGENAMDAACQQTLHLIAQLCMVDRLFRVIVHRGNYRRDDTFDIAGLHGVFSFSSYMIS